MICGLRDVGAIPTRLPAQAAALATTEAALSSIRLVNRSTAFRCTVELRYQVLPCFSASGALSWLRWRDSSPALRTLVQQAHASTSGEERQRRRVAARCHIKSRSNWNTPNGIPRIALFDCSLAYILQASPAGSAADRLVARRNSKAGPTRTSARQVSAPTYGSHSHSAVACQDTTTSRITGLLVNTHAYTDFTPRHLAHRQVILCCSRPGSDKILCCPRPASTVIPCIGSRIRQQASTHDDTSDARRRTCSVYILAKITAAAFRFLETVQVVYRGCSQPRHGPRLM